MARSSTTIKKGQVLNPSGAPKLPEELKLLMRSTSLQAKRDIYEVYNMPLSELFASESKPGISAGKAMLISCMNNCIQNGDSKTMAIFLDRIIGKPKEIIEVEDSEGETIGTKDQLIGQFVSMLFEKGKT